MSLFDDLGLSDDYDEEKDASGLGKFLSKPSPKPYQPFGGQMPQPQPQQTVRAPEILNLNNQFQPQPQNTLFNDGLGAYEQAKSNHALISKEASTFSQSASLYEDRYDDFMKNKLAPFYENVGGFSGGFESDDEYLTSLDQMYKDDLKLSQQDDGFFGESDEKKAAKERIGQYGLWNQPNGLRDQYLRLKQERDFRRKRADELNAQKIDLMDQMTAIPLPTRVAMDEQLKARGKAPRSAKQTNEMLNQFSFEDPIVGLDGEVRNLERTDPRKPVSPIKSIEGKASKSSKAQAQRMAAAVKGDIQGFLGKRQLVDKERQLRNKGVIMSQNGLKDGAARGLSRNDVDLLDIDKMRKAGIKSYKGQPLETAFVALGGEERLQLAKILEAVYSAKSNFQDAQLKYMRVAGAKGSGFIKQKMEQARESMNTAIGLAAEFGLDNELFEQAETVGWFAGLGNAIKKGYGMSKMAKYGPDFLTNTLDQDEIQDFIDIVSDMEDIPQYSALKRVNEMKSKNAFQAVGKLLFNFEVLPHMFLESMASFLPATFNWAFKLGPIGAAAGAVTLATRGRVRGDKILPAVMDGAKLGGKLGLRSSWAAASLNLEVSGGIVEGMQELGIDAKDPFIFAAAWNNEITRNAIKKKALQKGVPIAIFDGISAGLAGRLVGLREIGLNGGKLIDGASWAENLKYGEAIAPRFTRWQKTANVATEVGADSLLGSAGELFGQAFSKEAGEAWDWDAIAAEGIVGVGPGIFGGAMEAVRSGSNEFSNAPIQYSDKEMTPDGETGMINRAGFKRRYRTYNSADGMTTAILNFAGIDESNMNNVDVGQKVAAVQDWISNMWISDPEGMANLRIVFAERTTKADMTNEGTFEIDDDGNGVMYIKQEDLQNDPIGVFMHEIGHFARQSMFPDTQDLIDLYDGLSSDEKLQAFAEYYKKMPGKKVESFSDAEQRDIRKAYRKFTKNGVKAAAEEWFSYQFVRLLAGGQVNPEIKSDMQSWLKAHAYPYLKKFAGSDDVAGSNQNTLAARILSYMGRTPRGMDSAVDPYRQAPDMPGTETDFSSPGVRAPRGANVMSGLDDMEGLNFLVSQIKEEASTVADRVKLAKDVNRFMGKYVVPTDRKYFTDLQTEVAAAQEAEVNETIMPRVREMNRIISDPASTETEVAAAREELKVLNDQRDASVSDTGYDTRRMAELLARARVEEMSAADFAEPEVTESGKDGSGERAPKEPIRVKDGVIEDEVVKEPGKPNENLPLGTKGRKRKVVRRDDGTTRDLTEEEKLMLEDMGSKNYDPKGGVQVGRSYKPGKEEFEAGKRFRVTMIMPGNNQTNSRIEYFNTREEAQDAKEEFEYKNNTQRIERVLKKQKTIKDMLLNPDKLFKKTDAARKKIEARGEEVSTLAIIAEALDLSGMMNDSVFGSAFADMHLGEDRVRASGVKGRIAVPSMTEIQESLYLADKELEDALELIQLRENELIKEIDQLKKARDEMTGADEKPADEPAKPAPAKDKPAQDYSRTEIIQLIPRGEGGAFGLIKGYEIHKFVKGKGFTKDRDLTIEEYKNIKPFIRKIGNDKEIPKKRLELLNKKFLPNFKKKVPKKHHKQIVYWLKGSGKAKDAKPEKETEEPAKKKEEESKLARNKVPLGQFYLGMDTSVDDQIREAEEVLKNLRELKDTIVPEQKAIDWRDTPHPYIFSDKGKTRVTFGQLASKKDSLDNKGDIKYHRLVKGRLQPMDGISNPQQTLLETIESFDFKTFKDGNTKWVEEAGLTVEEYALHIEAIEAAMINPYDVGQRPMGDLRVKKDAERPDPYIGGFTVDKGTNYYLLAAHKLNKKLKEKGGERIPFVGTTPTTQALAMYEVANGRLYEAMGGDIEFRAQHRYQLLVQRMADYALKKAGETIKEMEKKGSTDPGLQASLKGYYEYFKKLIPTPDEIGSYAEENVYFPQILGGAAEGREGQPRGQDYARAFGNWLYFKDMAAAIDDFLDWEYIERPSVVPGGVEFSMGRDPMTGELNPSSLKEQLEHVKAFYEAKAAEEQSKYKKLSIERPVFGDFKNLDLGARPGEDTIFVSPEGTAGKTVNEAASGVVREQFEYIEPGEDPNTAVPKRDGVHPGFKRGAVDEPINIFDLIKEKLPAVFGPLQETLGTRVPTRWDTSAILDYVTPEPGTKVSYEYVDDMDVEITKDGQISRTRKKVSPSKAIKKGTVEWRLDEFGEGAWYYANNQKAKTFLTAFRARAKTKQKGDDVEFTAKAPIRVLTPLGRAIEDAWMSGVEQTASAGDADGNSVTLASIAEKLLVRMDSVRDLGMIPSSKNKQDRTGGPAGGMLFFAYEAFLKAAYEKLGIKEFETEATVMEYMDSIDDEQRDVTYGNKPHKLIIDKNGITGLFEVKADGLSTVALDGEILEAMVERYFGKSSKEVVNEIKARAKDQKPEDKDSGPKTKVTRIISGGQTGADQAGLQAARDLGLQTGGTAPKGYATDGRQDDSEKLKDFGLEEILDDIIKAYEGREKKYGPRTEQNVINSTGTVLFGNENSAGSKLTKSLAKKHKKPILINPDAKQLREWVEKNNIIVLNVAGNRESKNKGIYSRTRKILKEALGGEPLDGTSKPPRTKFKKVTIRYTAKELYVDGKLIEGSSVYEDGKIPQYDYIVNTLAPLMQAVVDARRVDLYGQSTRDDAVTIAMEPGKIDDPTKPKDDGDKAPEGLFDNTEQEPDLSESTVQKQEPDQDTDDLGIDPDATIGSTMRDQVQKALDKAKDGKEIRQRVWLLKDKARKAGKKELTLNQVVNEFRYDPTLWNAFGLSAPRVDAGRDNMYLDGWKRNLRENPKFAYFKKRVMEIDEPLGSGFSRRGFLKSLMGGVAAANLRTSAAIAGDPAKIAMLAKQKMSKLIIPLMKGKGEQEAMIEAMIEDSYDGVYFGELHREFGNRFRFYPELLRSMEQDIIDDDDFVYDEFTQKLSELTEEEYYARERKKALTMAKKLTRDRSGAIYFKKEEFYPDEIETLIDYNLGILSGLEDALAINKIAEKNEKITRIYNALAVKSGMDINPAKGLAAESLLDHYAYWGQVDPKRFKDRTNISSEVEAILQKDLDKLTAKEKLKLIEELGFISNGNIRKAITREADKIGDTGTRRKEINKKLKALDLEAIAIYKKMESDKTIKSATQLEKEIEKLLGPIRKKRKKLADERESLQDARERELSQDKIKNIILKNPIEDFGQPLKEVMADNEKKVQAVSKIINDQIRYLRKEKVLPDVVKSATEELSRALKRFSGVASAKVNQALSDLAESLAREIAEAREAADIVAESAAKEVQEAAGETPEQLALENEAVKGSEINIEPETQKEKEKVERQKPKDEDKQTLGSSFTLTAGLPDDYAGSARFLSRLSSKVGIDEEGREEIKQYVKDRLGKFSKSDFVSAFMDQSRPATRIISENLKRLGIDNKQALELFDIRGLWHQYYGKTDEVVRQADLQFIRPIYDAMREHGVTQQEWGEYLMARRAPSMNLHDRKIYESMIKDLEEAKPEDYEKKIKSIQELLDKRGDMLSGIATDVAIEAVKKYESMDHFKKFLDDSRNPLQKFYDMNREGLKYRAEGGLIQVAGDINEEKALVAASSTFNWKKEGGSRYMYQYNGKDSSYSYAPMQGFYDETQTLKDNDRAYEQTGKTSKSTGRAWDQPKHKFLFKGAFGRTSENAVGPDPMMTFAVAQDQFFDGAIRAHKNDVSNAFGTAFEMFRAIAYYGEKQTKSGEPIPDLETFAGGKELKRKIEKDPTIIEQAKDMFEGKNAVFRKEFKRLDAKMDYVIEEDAIEVEGKKIAGLKAFSRQINKEYQNDPLVFTYRKNGVPHYIQFAKNEEGARIAASLKNLKYEALPGLLQKANTLTRFLASMFTSRNPAFIIPNFFRDLGTAAIHLTEDSKKEFVGQALNPKRLGPIMRAIYEVERKGFKGEATMLDLPKDGDSSRDYVLKLIQNNEWQKVYQVAKQAGAKVGYFKLDTVPELIDNIQNELDKDKPDNKKVFKNFLSYLDASNTAVENSVRISSFVAAVESGRSIHEAANISRNVTVDFNQKGNMTQSIGSLFVFFGAGMNSIDRMYRTFATRTPEQRWALIGSLAGASFALNLFNRILSEAFGDDDDVVTDYDKISHYKRDTNAILTIPGTEQQFYLPVPLGYNMFWALGQTAADFLWRVISGRGGAGPAEFLTRNMESAVNAWTPFGASNLYTVGVPTMFKPIVELGANTNFMGHPIKYEDDRWGAAKPAHLLDPKRTNAWFTRASKGMNSLMGGDDQVKGTVGGLFGGDPIKGAAGDDIKWNISGSQMEHLLFGYLGGPGQIINALFSATAPVFLEESEFGEVDASKVPIVSRFYRNTHSNYYLNNMFNQLREMHDTANDVVKASKAVGGKFAVQRQKDMKDFLVIGKKIKYAEALRKEIRLKTTKIKESKIPEIKKRQRIDQLEKKEQDAYKAAIRQAQNLGLI